MSFHGLITHLFLVLNTIPLSTWTIVHLSIHLLKGILVGNKRQLQAKNLGVILTSLYSSHPMFNPSANFVSSTFWIYPKYDHFSPTPLVTTLISDDHLQKLLSSVLASICEFCGSFSISRKSYHSVLLSNKIPSH